MIAERPNQPNVSGLAVSRSPPRSSASGVPAALHSEKFLMAVVIVLLTAVSASSDDPITIRLEGTVIDTLPDTVEIFVSNPRKAAEELVKKGGKRDEQANVRENGPEFVTYRRVDYSFMRPEEIAPRGSDHQFKLGDMVYSFKVETHDEAKSFAKKHLLEKKGTTSDGRDKTKDLYAAKPGYFVLFLIGQTIYYCPLHPHQESDREGACPKCKLPFTKAKTYR